MTKVALEVLNRMFKVQEHAEKLGGYKYQNFQEYLSVAKKQQPLATDKEMANIGSMYSRVFKNEIQDLPKEQTKQITKAICDLHSYCVMHGGQ